jgi:predicted DNA-binding transcriptional regulator AlpA
MEIVGRSYTVIWQWIVDGKFPKARMAGRQLAWLSTEIENWIANLPPQQVKEPANED